MDDKNVDTKHHTADVLAAQAIKILDLNKQMESIRTLLTANNSKDEVHDLQKRLQAWRTTSVMLIIFCIVLSLLAI